MGKKTEFASKGEARIAIAKDVIKWMNAERLLAGQGHGYVSTVSHSLLFDGKDIKDNADLRKRLKGKECNVCALGAVFLTTVDRFNKVGCRDLVGGSWEGGHTSLRRKHITGYLKRYFTPLQMNMIESAYECGEFYGGLNTNILSVVNNIKKASNYGVDLHVCHDLGPKKRLHKIMKNIIKNEGTFKP